MFRTALKSIALATVTTLATLTPTLAGTAVPINRIDFAGAGGNFNQRYGTFVVPDSDTTVSAYGGKLTLYDVHIAKMIEVTQYRWCSPRKGYKGVYFNYEADNGKVFMGQIYISCQLAARAFSEFGAGRAEQTAIYDRGNGPERIRIPVLDLTGSKIGKFQTLVNSLKPTCVGNTCPGDRQ